MRYLIVGAGAVGQTYGYHLQRGGGEVAFLIKPHHEASLRDGLTMHRLKMFGGTETVVWKPDALFTRPEDAGGGWDQVWLCVASPALRKPWLDVLLNRLEPDAILVSLQPGLEDRALIAARWPEEWLVRGVITLIAFQSPLPGETTPGPGIAAFLPPGGAVPFDGPELLVREVTRALSGGGMAARHRRNAPAAAGFLSATMMPAIVALESEGWSIDALLRGDRLALSVRATRQAMEIVARETGLKPPWWRRLLGPRLLGLVLRVARRVLPIPLETYLKWHFTKVGAQTRQMMQIYLTRASAHELPSDAIAALAGALGGSPSGEPSGALDDAPTSTGT